jgi:hypothetical protein
LVRRAGGERGSHGRGRGPRWCVGS